jgi:chemotaxis protein MotB
MRAAAFALSAMFVLAGCATQEPVRIVDAVCDNASCEGRLAELRQKSRADLDAGNAARLAAEDCSRQKGAVERQLQAVNEAQAQAEKQLAEQGAELACSQGELASLKEKARSDVAACETMSQELQRQAEKKLAEQGAGLARTQRNLASLQEQARSDVAACETVSQELQRQAEKKLAEQGAGLARTQRDLASLREQAKTDVADREAMRQERQKYAKASEALAKQSQRMNDLEDRLRQKLQSDIKAKDVEIERLRSQVSVRVLDRILFESGSAEILPQGHRVLDRVATALEGGDETIRIEGHADIVPIGPELKKKYFSNWELSTARSSSVARFFMDNHGIEPTRMEAVGFSKYRPIAPNDTEENRQRNRRVEIVLTPWKPVVEECAAQE